MGNYISCTLASPVGRAPCRATKVIFPSGDLRHLYEPTKAAELMLEIPNSFIVNTRSLQIGKRFSALNADEDLEIGNVYVFFPMNRVNSVVKAADMAALLMVANSSAKRISRSGVRILPESGAEVQSSEKCAAPKLNLEEIEPEFKQRMSMCRSKKPLLETIVEEPVSMR